MIKRCCTCKKELDLSFFTKSKAEKDGIARTCRVCKKAYYMANRERIIANTIKKTDKEKKRQYDKQRRFLKGEQLRAYDRERHKLPHRKGLSRKWVLKNPEGRKVIALRYAHKRRAMQLKASPSWSGELDNFILSEALELCQLRNKTTNLKWEVDHIVPLMGKKVCGLHTWRNFQVVPESYNRRKLNKFPYPTWIEMKNP